MSLRPIASVCFLATVSAFTANAQSVPAERANEARIDKLLKQMTLEEKMNLIRGDVEPAATNQGQAGYLPGVPRLGVPFLRFADGPPGVLTRIAGQAQTATMGVAATWSAKDAEANGVAIGREARSLGIDVVLQPFINIDRDITFARGYNTLGEDPYLSGVMAAGEVRGEQAQGVMSQAKHYVAYDSDSYNIFVDQQALHEVYVAPFEATIKAGVASIMCSYNKVNGAFACGNADTLKTILRDELGFKGFVTSDWGGVHNVHFINQGLTMEMPGEVPADSPFAGMMKTYFRTRPEDTGAPSKPNLAALAGMLGGTIPEETKGGGMDMNAFPMDSDNATMRSALKDGSITEATVTAAARLVLYEIDRFGYLDGKQKHNVTAQDLEGNGKIIEKTAEDAAVLLKNEGGVLPLKKDASFALIGPTAGQVAAIGTFGERSPGMPERQVGPLEALKKLAPGAKVSFAVADDMTGVPIGAGMLSHDGKPGLERVNEKGVKSVDATLDFTKTNGKALPPNSVVTWKGEVTVAKAGAYWFYLQLLGTRGILSIDGKEVGRSGAVKGTVHGDVQHATQDNGLPTTDGLDNVRRAVELTAGKHAIEVVTSIDTSSAPVQVRLNWMTPEARERDHAAAIAAAKNAGTAVVFVWTRDKPHFELPGEQDKLIEEIAAVNPNTVVVLNTSQPVAMPWIDKVKGVVEMWWPGDEGGVAEAKTLLGLNNPGGKLPMTWGKELTDYAANSPAHPERSTKGVDGKTTFSEGVLVGYRWFDDQKIEPLFPFGYGLSYTKFAMSGLTVKAAGDGGVDVSVKVKNTGSVRGDEVPQVYLDAPATRPAGVQFAPRTLVGFDRVTLEAGEERGVTLHVAPRAFEYWSVDKKQWVKPGGQRTMMVGSSSRELPLNAVVPE
ncbi:beta-glucosidase [Granulicella tundricola]|uniref:Glycoside hydrolase family 3 domain protein n=1 Tax=Granulicella tundricola (strain ATCC BAA-1859 / DSM 23138 / MP5ACTX9) TaxID=1198114 RepID=E8WZZ8_GRATM|nr:glycoside hydrolase family 3 C-terminal domain-containing protein [Granulicella tundricola]ADW68894.1 glycoside hydrolase family 3 domain protein [Granulicella tundricola MP5ACTX9]